MMQPDQAPPTEPPTACLVVIEASDSALVGQTVEVTTPRFIIGRGTDAPGLQIGLHVTDYHISRYHADIRYMIDEGADEYGFYVRDMFSENGTKLNGQTIQSGTSVRLTDGDEIRLGLRMVLKFSLTG